MGHHFPSIFAALSLFPLFGAAELYVTSQLFQLSSGDAPNNVKLSWSLVSGASSYNISRLSSSGTYKTVATAPGDTYDLYGLTGTGTYRIDAISGSSIVESSSTFSVTPGSAATVTLNTYDNTAVSTLSKKSTLVLDDIYYKYTYVSDSNGFNYIYESTSTDGYTFSGTDVVLSRSTVCASVSDGYCKLESINYHQHPTTHKVVMWAHFENADDYTLGEVAVAYGTPGENFTFGGAFQPEGDDSRDLTFFVDDDDSGYLVSAINTNTNLGLYALNSDWTNITSKVATLQASEYREAPALVHNGDYYYLFSSRAAGWYPSPGKYISSESLTGTWASSRYIGNIANFGAQSGGVSTIGDNYYMAANRWGHQWSHAETSNRQIILPIAFDNGFAAYNYYSTISYNDDSGILIPIQNGKILSVGKTASSSGAESSYPASYANDGTQNSATNLFVPSDVPFWWEVDLEDAHEITQIDVSAKQVSGSEVYLTYNITGSTDGETYSLIVDETDNTAVGFTSSQISDSTEYRYIRITVSKVINVQNSHEADWSAGLYELTVYGE